MSTDNTNNNSGQQDDLEKLYERYCDCRDQELERFWKNSTYVWIFLALCFGGFSQVLLKHIELKTTTENIYDLQKSYELLLCIISFAGLICSFIWVWMARGMKAWFEVFENALWKMDKDNVFKLPNNNEYNIENFWRLKDNLFVFQKAFFGAESNSPSKIVILIGRILCFIWSVAFLWALLSAYNIISAFTFVEFSWWILIPLVISAVLIYFSHFCIQGSVLLSDGEIEVKKLIETQIDTIIKEKNKGTQADYSIQMTIIRFFGNRRFNVSFNNNGSVDVENDFKSLKGSIKSKYFDITEIKKVNDNMIKIGCKAKNYWKDVFNMDRYNLHTENTNEHQNK